MGKVYAHPPPTELSKLIWSWRSPSYPCEKMYHARKAAAARSISTLTKRGEGGADDTIRMHFQVVLYFAETGTKIMLVFTIQTTVTV